MRFIIPLLFITSFSFGQWTPYNVNMEVKGKFQADKNIYFKQGADSGKVWMCIHDSTGLGQWTTFSGGGSIDTSTLPYYHDITQINDTILSFNKLTGLKDTIEFLADGINVNLFNKDSVEKYAWSLTGNTGTTAGTNFIGTTDSTTFLIKTNNTERLRINGMGDLITTTPFASSFAYFSNGDTLPGLPFNLPHIGLSTGDALNDYGGLIDIEDATVFGGQVQTITGMRNNTSGEKQLLILGRTKSCFIFSDTLSNKFLQRYNLAGTRLTRGNNDEDTAINMLDIDENVAIGSSYSGISAAPTNGLIVEGNVGIGTNSPTTNLHVNGSIRIVDGTQGAGKVLTSDASGLASWQTLALTDTATLDFGTIAPNGHQTLTITATGAALSDVVSLGIPNASMSDHASYVAWVSASDTVSVKCFNFDGSSFDPAAGLFTVKVFK